MTDKDPWSQVDEIFKNSTQYVNETKSELQAALTALGNIKFDLIDFTALDNSNPLPEFDPSTLGDTIQVDKYDPADIGATLPTKPTYTTLPTITELTIGAFEEAAPVLPALAAPTITYGATPTVPAVADVSIPEAPSVQPVPLPSYLSLTTPTFAGVDLHEDMLAQLENIPALELISPTPFSYARGADYASSLLSALQAALQARLDGGTGLPAAVEQALWDRARERETNAALGNVNDVLRSSENLGFALPAGVVSDQLRRAQSAYYDKLSTLSRDISIEQAKLEQENLKHTVESIMKTEAMLIDYSYKIEQLRFEAAKEYTESAIKIYNSGVDAYKAVLAGYQMLISAYDAIIKGELSKVEVYKAELQAEETKASINNTLVQQYKAQIEASMSLVEIYKAQIGAAQAVVSLEQTKVSAAGEQIKAYVAQINAETAKLEAFKTQVQAQSLQVDMYKSKAEAYGVRVNAEAAKAKANIEHFTAVSQANQQKVEEYKADIQHALGVIEKQVQENASARQAYGASIDAYKASLDSLYKEFESTMKATELNYTLALQQEKYAMDNARQIKENNLEAAKIKAQVLAQLMASAYSMQNANASISGTHNSSNSASYNYSNDTVSAQSNITSF